LEGLVGRQGLADPFRNLFLRSIDKSNSSKPGIGTESAEKCEFRTSKINLRYNWKELGRDHGGTDNSGASIEVHLWKLFRYAG
jgi:hypothetical protein